MLNFLKSLWGFFSNPIEALWHEILNIISSVYSYFDSLISSIERDLAQAWHAFSAFADSVGRWVTHEVDSLINLIASDFKAIVKWAGNLIGDALAYAKSGYQWALRQLDNLSKFVSSTANSIVRWVVANIWQPLDNYITSAINWIDRYGSKVWDLVSNPEKLVAWIASYLLRAWLKLLTIWAVPITAFILQRARLLIPDLVSIIEDVITKVL